MPTVPKPHPITAVEYLERERRSLDKHEFLNGEVFAIAGAKRAHRRITGNIYTHFYSTLREGRTVDNSDTRIHVPATGLYTYSDVVVTCGDEQYLDASEDTLLNPTLIIEVLSPSTEANGSRSEIRSLP